MDCRARGVELTGLGLNTSKDMSKIPHPQRFCRPRAHRPHIASHTQCHSCPASPAPPLHAASPLPSPAPRPPCPHRFSIHVTDRTSAELKAAQRGLPAPVPGLPPLPPLTPTTTPAQADAATMPPPASAPGAPGAAAAPAAAEAGAAGAAAAGAGEPVRACVYYTGWTTEKSFAGCPYLVVRPEVGLGQGQPHSKYGWEEG